MKATAALSPARACAFSVLRRVFEQGAYADRALRAEAAGLPPRERALATQLAYGSIQRRATLDHVASKLSSRPLQKLDPPVLAALRLGLFQLLFLGGIADHAAVNESVELAKRSRTGGVSYVNAVLRRAVGEGQAILSELDDATPATAAIRHSVPRWLAEQWWEELGSVQTRALLARVNEPAESCLRVNTLTATADEVRARLPVPSLPARGLPEALVLDDPFDAHGSELFAQGAIMPQSRASMQVAQVLSPRQGDRVLDLCAAPGAKSTHIAALMRDQGDVLAVERHTGRAAALEQSCRRMRTNCVRVEIADASQVRGGGKFDRVLVDPPCSGLGTLQSRPDLRWRTSAAAIVELSELQRRILHAAAAAVAGDGVLVYSVCTISRQESEDVVDGFLRDHREFSCERPYLQLLPHRDLTDGFFIARLRRARSRQGEVSRRRYPSSRT